MKKYFLGHITCGFRMRTFQLRSPYLHHKSLAASQYGEQENTCFEQHGFNSASKSSARGFPRFVAVTQVTGARRPRPPPPSTFVAYRNSIPNPLPPTHPVKVISRDGRIPHRLTLERFRKGHILRRRGSTNVSPSSFVDLLRSH